MDTKDGGPAFPKPIAFHANGDLYHSEVDGISRRDYFAAAALTGLIARPLLNHIGGVIHSSPFLVGSGPYKRAVDSVSDYAELAHELADAMIAQERETSK